jgi:hypothetical protein
MSRSQIQSRSVTGFLALALAAFCAGSAAAEPRSPTAKWNVNFGDAQCVAHRDYGTSTAPLRLVLKAPPVGDVMQVAVMRAGGSSLPQQVEATVTIGQRPPLKTNLLMYTPKASKERLYLLNMPSADFSSLRQAKTLSVRSEGLNETFALSEMEPLLKVVDNCVADLRRVFNIGPTRTDSVGLTRRAKTNLAKLFSDADYPDVAVRKDQSGRVGFALLIGDDGRVADCTIARLARS